MKILIVDDQPDVVKGILSGVNWERVGVDAAFGAHSGEEAKQVLQEEHIDILLCDIEMPGENGLEFFSWVRERYQDVKCIFLTAHADFTYAQKALKLEAADYLLQPASYAGVESSILRVSERIREEQLVLSLIHIFRKMLNKEQWEEQKEMAKAIAKSFDRTNPAYLEPLKEYLRADP